MPRKSAFCICSSEAQTSEVIRLLKAAGFSSNAISALLPDKTGTNDFAHEPHTKAPEGATAGGVVGGLLCAGLGWLAGAGLLAGDWAPRLLAAGPLLSALSGAAIGACLGGIIGALFGANIPEYEAKRYSGKIMEGNILVSVHCERDSLARAAKRAFQCAGASHISIKNESPVKYLSRRLPETAGQAG